jgi:putative transposase
MRQPRIIIRHQPAVYHCISRCVGNQLLLGIPERERFRAMLSQQARFCGVQVITYVLMHTHFHLEIRVTPQDHLTDLELLGRAERFYRPQDPTLVRMRREMEQQGALSAQLRQRLLQRMGQLSCFIKELKQRFTRWYNRRHDRIGTLWAERFRSQLVEDRPEAARTVALYIDLNPVRAGLVIDPKDYRFCGYAEAVAGDPEARAGLLSALGQESWETGGQEYRKVLFLAAGSAGAAGKVVLDRSTILKQLQEGAEISKEEALRLKLRHLSCGLVLGSRAYVEEIFQQFRGQFGKTRRTGARKLKGLPFKGLRTLRDLRVRAVS